MTTADQPITRSELREELRHYATKADLANLKAWMIGTIVAINSIMVGVGLGFAKLIFG